MWWCGMTDDHHRTTLVLTQRLNDNIEERLSYEDSKSEWIREACRRRLQSERADE